MTANKARVLVVGAGGVGTMGKDALTPFPPYDFS